MNPTVLTMYEGNPNGAYLDMAVNTLKEGGIVIYPTDTLYAIGCDALNLRAIERVCAVKGINPLKTNLSVICRDISMAADYARIDNRAFKLMRSLAPGPYTFLLPAASTLPKAFKGRRTVGVRIPANNIAAGLVERLGHPMLTTSVEIDPDDEFAHTEPESIAMRYSGVADMVIDGGTGSDRPSTVIDLADSSAPQLVRAGAGAWPI